MPTDEKPNDDKYIVEIEEGTGIAEGHEERFLLITVRNLQRQLIDLQSSLQAAWWHLNEAQIEFSKSNSELLESIRRLELLIKHVTNGKR